MVKSGTPLSLDVVVPTHRRPEFLERALASLVRADVPEGLEVTITVVDNASGDRTPDVVERWREISAGRIRYASENRLGRSNALNTGIGSGTGDLVGMIDDDEEIAAGWYTRIERAFSDGELDFIGGPYVPRWGAPRPPWFPDEYRGVIGWVDAGERPRPFDHTYPGILMGGNAVIRRKLLDQVGPYSPALGRMGGRLLSGEDRDMYDRLRAAGARGMYFPDLVIYHFVPRERLSKRYFRRWCFWHGVSLGVLHHARPSNVAHLAGIPRYLFGSAVRGLARNALRLVSGRREPAMMFQDELALWDLGGFLYGAHWSSRRH